MRFIFHKVIVSLFYVLFNSIISLSIISTYLFIHLFFAFVISLYFFQIQYFQAMTNIQEK